ncbi:YcaO-like family protein [Streptomyces sp. NPDC092296]|uniref:YcaO-like family protein n=1 Tax=Streptomyces sp. NPDC092296 TaxID=3366012 RepID=UPI0037FC1494
MIDFTATLDPEAGLVRGSELRSPQGTDVPLWQGLVTLAWEEDPDADADRTITPEVVGACGVARSDVLVRAAGEAVERFALRPARADRGFSPRPDAERLDHRAPEVALGGADLDDRRLTWYPARRLTDGADLQVAAGLVDYPADEQQADGFDPSPSGAASGDGRDMALRSALLEVVERDAVLVAWARRLALPRVDLDESLRHAPATPAWRRLARALKLARDSGVEPVLAQVPTGIPGVVCAVGVVLDRYEGHPLAAVGCNASADWGKSLAGALQEAMQIRTVLQLTRRVQGDVATPEVVTGDIERALYFSAEAGAGAAQRWCAGFTDAVPVWEAGDVPVTVEHLVHHLDRQGARPVAVDLSHRLPAGLREMGWAAVKVIPAGLQPLRMDERTDFGWNLPRLASAESRTGLAAHAHLGSVPAPHPLI